MKNLFFAYIVVLQPFKSMHIQNPDVSNVHSGFCVPKALHSIAQNKI